MEADNNGRLLAVQLSYASEHERELSEMRSACETLIDPLDDLTHAVLLVIAHSGFDVWCPAPFDGEIYGRNEGTGERFVVRAEDPYDAAIELARQVGIELGDG